MSAYGKAIYGEDVFDGDFTAAEERDSLLGGHLLIVPRAYTVLSDNYAPGKKGDVLELALPMEVEATQVSGGHIERVQPAPVEEPTKKPATTSRKKQN